MKPDYKNWMPKGMVLSFCLTFLGLCAVLAVIALLAEGSVRTVLLIVFGVLAAVFLGLSIWAVMMYCAFDYHGKRRMSRQIIDGTAAYALEIYEITHDKIRFADREMNITSLADDGAYIGERVAKAAGVGVGDEITFSPYGTDESYTVPVAGVCKCLSESIMMTRALAEKAGVSYTISAVFTDAAEIEANDRILNTQSKQAIMDSFETFVDLMNKMIWLLVIAAVALGIVVLYNLGVMSYTERYREMATLKVVGFKNSKIGRLLISQNMWLTVIGILIGLPAGVGVLQYLLTALASEYEMKLTLGPGTYLVSIVLTFGVSLAVGLMVAKKNRHIDMVAALKTEE